MRRDHQTTTEDAAARFDRAQAYENTPDTDHDDGTVTDHDPCDRRGCLVCDVLPRAWAEHIEEQSSEWWETA